MTLPIISRKTLPTTANVSVNLLITTTQIRKFVRMSVVIHKHQSHQPMPRTHKLFAMIVTLKVETGVLQLADNNLGTFAQLQRSEDFLLVPKNNKSK